MKAIFRRILRPFRRDSGLHNPNEIFIFYTVLLLAFGSVTPAFSQKATAVTGVSITVEDLDREVDFFTRILDFQKVNTETWKGESVAQLFGLPAKTTAVTVVTLQLGAEQVRLMDFDGPPSRAIPADTHSNDLWFQHLAIVVRDMDQAYQKLLQAGVTHVSTSPQTLPDYLPNAAGIKAFYFRDPEGHNLELIWFPPGKGNPRWQAPAPSQLFLGIDHTAIAVHDTKTSLGFYRDALGLEVGGHSENYGPEQEHLNQVFGARLDINGLHAGAGFGVEFLRYIAPPDGRAFPATSRTTDLWHYQTELTVDDLEKMIRRLAAAGYKKISARPALLGTTRVFLLRDPDGHAVLLRQENT